MKIKEPGLEVYGDFGTAGEGRRIISSSEAAIAEGTEVFIGYEGDLILARIVTVEEPGQQFVGEVLEFFAVTDHETLSREDLFRFRRENLRIVRV